MAVAATATPLPVWTASRTGRLTSPSPSSTIGWTDLGSAGDGKTAMEAALRLQGVIARRDRVSLGRPVP